MRASPCAGVCVHEWECAGMKVHICGNERENRQESDKNQKYYVIWYLFTRKTRIHDTKMVLFNNREGVARK